MTSPTHGRVSVTVDTSGIRLAGDESMGDELLEAVINIGSFLALGGLAVAAVRRFMVDDPLGGAALIVAALALGYRFLRFMVESAVGYLMLPVMVVFMIVMLPFPAGRRRIRSWFVPTDDPLHTPAAEIIGVTVRTGWRTSVVVRRRGREPLRLHARGERGRQLAAVMGRR